MGEKTQWEKPIYQHKNPLPLISNDHIFQVKTETKRQKNVKTVPFLLQYLPFPQWKSLVKCSPHRSSPVGAVVQGKKKQMRSQSIRRQKD